jgi:uncharacterized protein YjdB
MRINLIVVSVAAAMLAACDQSTTPAIAGLGGTTSVPSGGGVSSNTAPLAILPNHAQLLVGATFQFTTNAPTSLQNQVQWSSLQSTVATVSPTGLITAVAVGTATITARYSFDSTRVATATVDVTKPTTTTTGTSGMTSGSGLP